MRASRCSPGRGGERHAVAADALVDPHRLDRGLQAAQPGRVGDRVELDLLLPALDPAGDDVVLLARGGVAEADPQQEPVELRLGQRVGAFVLDRVGGREHVERLGQREGLALDGDLPLLHRLEQRGLGLGRRAVDLVGEQQAGEQRAAAELELRGALVVEERPGEVGGQQVGGELGAGEVEPQGLGERARGQGLAEPGVVLEQHVSLGEDRAEHQPQRLLLADDRLADLVEHPGGERRRPPRWWGAGVPVWWSQLLDPAHAALDLVGVQR